MKHIGMMVVALSSALAACSDQSVTAPATATAANVAPFQSAAPGRGVEGRYIVVLNDGADARGLAKALGANPRWVYTSALNGFSAELSPGQLTAVLHHRDVAYVEQDQTARAAATQLSAPWGLDRIDQRTLPLSGSYSYNVSGSGVTAYIIDSGIEFSHPALAGSSWNAWDAWPGGPGTDCNGHGTHVAGIVGGNTTYGTAKGSPVLGVKVMGCSGTGIVSDIIAGTDWVRLNRANPAVASMALTTPYSAALNTAVTNLVNSGVFVAVAAGDGNVSACNLSPASAAAAFTVAASDASDWRWANSNYGTCVDMYAPGVNIPSLWLGGTTATASGSSQAAAFVTGVAALYKGQFGQVSSLTISSWLIRNATLDVIKGNASGTYNRLLWKGVL
jgi:subtilisin family serine protease